MHASSNSRIAAVLNQRKQEEQSKVLEGRSQSAKPSRKKPIEEDVLVKQKLMQHIGVVNPLIRNGVESTLNNVIYKRRTYFEVNDQFISRIDKQIEDLTNQRKFILGVKTVYEISLLNSVYLA